MTQPVRSAALAALLLVAAVGRAGEDHGDAAGATRTLLEEGETKLAARDVDSAQAAFERAAAIRHAPEIEVSLVRTYLQAGEYRRALTFAAHAAGAHTNYPAASAFYAWILHVGGQPAVARRLLDSATVAAKQDVTLRVVSERLAQPWPVADGALLVPPVRVAPYADVEPEVGVIVSSAMLIDGGRKALVPSGETESLSDQGKYWLRNGLGQTVRATLERRVEIAGTTIGLLRLDHALPMPSDIVAAGRQPFAGSVGYSVEYAATAHSAAPQWPLLRLGFIGRAPAQSELPLLGIEVPAGPRGGPVFDDAGRLAGLAVPGSDARDRLLPVALLHPALGTVFGPESLTAPSPRMTLDHVYERSLLLALQLIAARTPGG